MTRACSGDLCGRVFAKGHLGLSEHGECLVARPRAVLHRDEQRQFGLAGGNVGGAERHRRIHHGIELAGLTIDHDSLGGLGGKAKHVFALPSDIPATAEFRGTDCARDGSLFGSVNFAEGVQDLMIEMVVNLLQHKNPHTGRTYAEDPALAFIELQNEDDIFFYTTSSSTRDLLLHGAYRAGTPASSFNRSRAGRRSTAGPAGNRGACGKPTCQRASANTRSSPG